MKSEVQKNPDISKKFLTLFILFFPSLIIAALPGFDFLMIALKVLLLFYQFIVINNFVNTHFTE